MTPEAATRLRTAFLLRLSQRRGVRLDPNSGLTTLFERPDGRPVHNSQLRRWTDGTNTIQVDESALEFDGSTQQYLNRTSETALRTAMGSNYTVAAWVKLSLDGTSNMIAAYVQQTAGVPADLNFQLQTNSPGRVSTAVRWNGNLAQAIGTTTIPDDEWCLVALTRSGGTVKAWLNGAEDATATNGTLGTNVGAGATFAIGARPAATSADYTDLTAGRIGPVTIWNRVLSGAELLALVNGGTALQYDSFSSGQRSGLIAYIVPGATSGANDLRRSYPLTRVGSPTEAAGPGLALTVSPPTFSDADRSVTLSTATRGLRIAGASPMAGKSAWTFEDWTRGRIGNLGSDTVIRSLIGSDGSGFRVLAKANGRVSVERLAAGGSVAASATTVDTIGGRVQIASSVLTSVDSSSRQQFVFAPAEGWADHDLKNGDIVKVTGAAGIGSAEASVAKVDFDGSVTLIYEGTGKTAPTGGEITTGVFIEHEREIELSDSGGVIEVRQPRLPNRLGIEITASSVRVTMRGRVETLEFDGGVVPDDAVETIGAPLGSSLGSAPLSFHGVRDYGGPLSASQEAEVAVSHGLWFSRTSWVGPSGFFFDAEEYGPFDRRHLAHYRVASCLCRPDGSDVPELDWYDGVHETPGHPYWGHNTLRYPVGHRWAACLGRVDQEEQESTDVWVLILGPEHTESDLTPETTPEQIYFGKAKTIVVDPIPDTWTTAAWTAASPPSLGAQQAVTPCTLWTFSAESLSTGVVDDHVLRFDGVTGPFVVAGPSGGAVTIQQPEVRNSVDVHFRNMLALHGGSEDSYLNHHAITLATFDRVRVGDPDNRLDEFPGFYSGSGGASRFVIFTRGWVRNGTGYGIFPFGDHYFLHFSAIVLDPVTSASPNTTTMRTAKTRGLSFSGRTRVAAIGGASGGLSLRHSTDGSAVTFDWAPGERLDGDSGEQQPNRAWLVDHVYAHTLLIARNAYGLVRRCLGIRDGLPAIEVSNQTYARFLPIDVRALGNRTPDHSTNYRNFRYAPATGLYANPQSDTFAYGTITAPATVAARSGAFVRYSTLGYPGGGATGLMKDRVEVQDAATGAVSTVEAGQIGSSYGVFRASNSVRVRVVAVEIDTDGDETGNEVAGAWSEAV